MSDLNIFFQILVSESYLTLETTKARFLFVYLAFLCLENNQRIIKINTNKENKTELEIFLGFGTKKRKQTLNQLQNINIIKQKGDWIIFLANIPNLPEEKITKKDLVSTPDDIIKFFSAEINKKEKEKKNG